jgi:hypothetical protein
VPQLVRRSGKQPAFDVQALTTSGGLLALIWRQLEIDGSQSLIHAAFDSAGNAWTALDAMPLPTNANELRVSVGPCRSIHAIYEHPAGSGDSIHLDHAIWRNRWQVPRHLFSGYRATSADFDMDSSGNAVLAFLAQPRSAPITSRMMPVYARLSAR